jgi:mono/diheme cytochrome c family protein
MRWAPLVAWGALVFAVVGLFEAFSHIDLNAVQPPGHAEEYLRSALTRAIVRRRFDRENIPPPPPDYQTSMSISAGRELFAADCSSCHGPNGNDPTAARRGMSPRAVAFDSAGVQRYSDRELFSIVEEGIRFTGMPGFAGAETNDQICNLVDFLRALDRKSVV